jgi:hypothetical protein
MGHLQWPFLRYAVDGASRLSIWMCLGSLVCSQDQIVRPASESLQHEIAPGSARCVDQFGRLTIPRRTQSGSRLDWQARQDVRRRIYGAGYARWRGSEGYQRLLSLRCAGYLFCLFAVRLLRGEITLEREQELVALAKHGLKNGSPASLRTCNTLPRGGIGKTPGQPLPKRDSRLSLRESSVR